MFMAMIESIREDSLEYIFRIEAIESQTKTGVFRSASQEFIHPEAESMRSISKKSTAAPFGHDDFGRPTPPPPPHFGPAEPVKRQSPKVGRNDPCPCGKINPKTGKPLKYKFCCYPKYG
jgi:preprotein translocase subunit SecA